jgi:hypothetical protein
MGRQHSTRAGNFVATVESPADGEYQIVVSNNLLGGETSNEVHVETIGIVSTDPAELQVNNRQQR